MLLTKSNWFIIGPVATLLGFVMNGIYLFMDKAFSIENIAICIILFTIIVNLLLLPLTIKQQKSMKIQSVMTPELRAIEKKYKNKNDNASLMKKNEETQALYAKYGVSMMGSCVTLLIQMPILFAMYQVILKIPAYINGVYNVYDDLVKKLLSAQGAQEFVQQFATQARVNFEKAGFTENTIIDVLYNFRPENWTHLEERFPEMASVIADTASKTAHINNFFGINIADAPMSILQKGLSNGVLPLVVAILVPALSGLTQYLSTKLVPQQNSQPETEQNAMASSMKTMNTVMPLMSVFIGFSLSIGLGIYWIANAVVRSIIQVIVNKKMDKLDIDKLVEKNVEKYNEKRKKKGLPPDRISGQARANLRNLQNVADHSEEEEAKRAQRLEDMKKSTEYYNNTAKPGSIASKARMVQQYNEKNLKKK